MRSRRPGLSVARLAWELHPHSAFVRACSTTRPIRRFSRTTSPPASHRAPCRTCTLSASCPTRSSCAASRAMQANHATACSTHALSVAPSPTTMTACCFRGTIFCPSCMASRLRSAPCTVRAALMASFGPQRAASARMGRRGCCRLTSRRPRRTRRRRPAPRSSPSRWRLTWPTLAGCWASLRLLTAWVHRRRRPRCPQRYCLVQGRTRSKPPPQCLPFPPWSCLTTRTCPRWPWRRCRRQHNCHLRDQPRLRRPRQCPLNRSSRLRVPKTKTRPTQPRPLRRGRLALPPCCSRSRARASGASAA